MMPVSRLLWDRTVTDVATLKTHFVLTNGDGRCGGLNILLMTCHNTIKYHDDDDDDDDDDDGVGICGTTKTMHTTYSHSHEAATLHDYRDK
jgi:hypothetical protein